MQPNINPALETAKKRIQKAMEYAIEHRPSVGGFPFLAECLRQAGVQHNIWSLPSAQSVYIVEGGWVVQQMSPLVTGIVVTPTFNEDMLVSAIRDDQEGKTTFPEFLHATWNAGVVGYDVDFDKRTVTYMGAGGEVYTEEYENVEVGEVGF
jgi:uncharacterized protein YbcV (DUF1398 family)